MYKKIYDENKGVFVLVNPWTGEAYDDQEGSGIYDMLASVGQKIFSSSVKEATKKALETAGKTALESGTKKIGSEVGNLAADKMINAFKKGKQTPPNGDLIVKELSKLNDENNDINIRINKLLSGSGRHNRIKKLIYN